jgi:protein phosphatase
MSTDVPLSLPGRARTGFDEMVFRSPDYPALGSAASPQTPMLDVEFAQLSDRGRVRELNEDCAGYVVPETPEQIRTRGWLFALADGVGGQECGEVASRTAVASLLAGFRNANGGERHTVLLRRLVKVANAEVYDAGMADGTAMATTLVACALRFDRAVVAHVGDSRCYLIRRGYARLLTRDHTVANEQRRMGLLSGREGVEAATGHLLSRVVGGERSVSPDTGDHQVLPGDILLLCSDGLHGALTAPEIGHMVGRDADLQTAARELVAVANQRDGSDNVSVQLIRVRKVERVGMYRGRAYRLR